MYFQQKGLSYDIKNSSCPEYSSENTKSISPISINTWLENMISIWSFGKDNGVVISIMENEVDG